MYLTGVKRRKNCEGGGVVLIFFWMIWHGITHSKYPEVDILKSTSFAKVKPVLDSVFARHGVPEEFSCDNGPPFNGDEIKQYSKEIGMEFNPVTPEDPQCNGFAENFVKTICKLIHTSCASNKDPRQELQNFLLQYRATPHLSTGRSPAEMLMNRRIRTKLPQVPNYKETAENSKARDRHDKERMKQKQRFDKRRRAKPKIIEIGDKVLVKQEKSTTKPPYNPEPLTVTMVKGNRVTATNGVITRVRDKNQLKRLPERPAHLLPPLADSKHNEENNVQEGSDRNTSKTPNEVFPDLGATTTEASATLFALDPDMAAEMQRLSERALNANVVQDEDIVPTAPANRNEDGSSSEAFTLDEESATEMQRLFDQATLSITNPEKEAGSEGSPLEHTDIPQEEGRSLRSAGKSLQWNTELGNDNVLL